MLKYNNTDIELIPHQCYIARVVIEEGPWKGHILPNVYTKYLGNGCWNGIWNDLGVCQLTNVIADLNKHPFETYIVTILEPIRPKTKVVLNHV